MQFRNMRRYDFRYSGHLAISAKVRNTASIAITPHTGERAAPLTGKSGCMWAKRGILI